jgi:hypothetical protein
MNQRPQLRLIHGGRDLERNVGGVRVWAAPLHQPPFEVDAVVYQEDTYGVLAAPTEVEPDADHPVRVFHGAARLEPSPLGSVCVVEEKPLRLHAVVCDLDADAPCCATWIERAFAEVLRLAAERRLARIGAEILGAAYGHLEVEEAAGLLLRVLAAREVCHPSQLWLIVPGGIDPSRVFAAVD